METPNGAALAPSSAAQGTFYAGRVLFVNGRPVTAARFAPSPRYTQLVPARVKSKNYEYIFNDYGTYADIFNYPKSTAMIGQINGAGGQGCTNVLYGYGKNVFWNVPETNGIVVEYQVPQKVLKTLHLDYTSTSSCAMSDSGDLAVGVLYGNSQGPGGQVIVFKKASGSGKVYRTPLSHEYFDGYDPKGDLFADGLLANFAFALVELPNGSSKFVTVKTSNAPQSPGSVQWDGTYLDVFDQGTNEVYRYTVSGRNARLNNTIRLSGVGDCAQTWLVPGLLYCADAGNFDGEVFKFPAGGSPIATFTGNFDLPLGVTAARK